MSKTHNTIIFSIFYILGIISFYTDSAVFLAFLLLVALFFMLYKNFVSCRGAVIFYFAFALALLNCHFQIKNFDDLSSHIPSECTLTGTVLTIPTTNSPTKTKFYLKAESGSFSGKEEKLNAKTIVTLYDTKENIEKIKIADSVKLQGTLRNPIRAKNPSQFDYANYLKNHKTFSTFYVKDGKWEIVSQPENAGGKFLQKLNDKRTEILNIHRQYLKSPNIEVLGGIVFGDDAINPPDDIKNSFINSGLLHILAASGMNVSIIFGIWFFIGTRLRLNYRAVILLGAVLVAFYTLMTGMGPSVLRAALMIEFVLFGKLIDRAADSIALVFLVAFLMLLYDPAMISDVGFQLSFVVTFALMFYCPPVLENMKNKFAEFAAGAVFIPFVAQLFAAPIQMYYFNTFATYSILANFVITPFIMVISFLGFLASIIAMIPVDIIAQKTCMFFDAILNPVVTMLVSISHYFAALPNALISTIHPSHFRLILYYSILLCIGFLLRDKFKNKKLALTTVILCVVFAFSFINFENKNCEIIVFDVGNADSFLIKTPHNKYIMIDTAHGRYGKSSFSQAESIMGKYLKDNGIKDIELMILTHFDSDHSGGAVDIMRTVKVHKVLLNQDEDNSKTTKALLKYINENKVNTQTSKNNEIVYNEQNFQLKTLCPDFVKDKNDNDNSTITLLSYGDFDMLFMADGGVRSFNKIKKDLHNDKIEVLKSGHHGGKNTVTSKMLKTINPDAAIISTGYNTYGHPTKSTLETIAKNGIKIYRTDTSNAIKISASQNDYKILKYNPAKKRFVEDRHVVCRNSGRT